MKMNEMIEEKKVKISMFVKNGCSACKSAKQRIGGLLNDLSDIIDIEIITTNPQIVVENELMYAPTMRFNGRTQKTGELIGSKITADAIFDQIKKMRFGTK